MQQVLDVLIETRREHRLRAKSFGVWGAENSVSAAVVHSHAAIHDCPPDDEKTGVCTLNGCPQIGELPFWKGAHEIPVTKPARQAKRLDAQRFCGSAYFGGERIVVDTKLEAETIGIRECPQRRLQPI